MALPDNIGDREHRKFVEDANGDVSIRIGPNAIKDSDGNKLSLNSYGMAQTHDKQVMTQLKEMTDALKDIRFQLQLITGAEIHE
jgi:hypothetical protein